jgi:hypothetical protein
MGAGASSVGSQTAKTLAKDMLNGIYANTNIAQFMELSKRSSCSKFAFDYKESLLKHMKDAQLYPMRGEKGIITVLPLEDLVPTKATPEMASLLKRRDEFCVDAGYLYVSIFQIYFALAVNLFDASPLRTMMRGGGIPQSAFPSAEDKRFYANLDGSMLSPFAEIKNLITKFTSSSRQLALTFNDSSKATVEFNGYDLLDKKDLNNITIAGFYGAKDTPVNITFTRKVEDVATFITVSIEDIEIIHFKKTRGPWRYTLEFPITDETDYYTVTPNMNIPNLLERLTKHFGEEVDKKAAPRTTASTSTSTGVTVASGSSMYIGFEKTRSIIQSAQSGKTEYPIAYAIGRALTVMFPLDPKDATVTNQRISQICKKTLDFEKNGSYLPKEGSPIKENIYYASLIGLYYDEYILQGDKVTFTKSSGGNKDLESASNDLYTLYTNKADAAGSTFIEKGNFRKLDDICQTTGNLMFTSPQVINVLMEQVVKKLLALQEKYTVDAEKLIQKLFKIDVASLADGKKAVSIDFAPGILKAGRVELDKIRVEARKLLLNYYMMADSYYFSAVDYIKKNPTAVRPV